MAFLVCQGFAPTASAQPESIIERRWFEARSAYFHTYSCGPTQEVARLAARLEQFREAYSLLAGTQAVASPPIVVMAYPSHADMMPFLPHYQGKPANLTAFFKPDSDENLIVMPLGSSVSLEAVFHEYTHLLLRHNGPFWPLWLKEGVAEIYSTFELTGPKRTRIGHPLPRHLELLSERPLMPLADLFAVNHKSPEYNEEYHQGIFYAQSWLLAHYLMLGGNRARTAQFAQMTPLLRQGQLPEQAFTNAFRTSFAVMENELRAYLARQKFSPHEFTLARDISGPRVLSTRILSPAETCFRLGDQLLRVGRMDAAESYFERSRTFAPRSPLAVEGLGLLASERKNSQEAARLLGEALQLGSTNFLAHYVYAREKYRLTSRSPGTYIPLQDERAVEIRGHLQKALSLMPNFGPAHHLLGFLEMVEGDNLASAEKHLRAAIQLEPEEQAYLFSLAQVRLLREGPQAARSTLEPLRRANVPAQLREQAEEMLKEIERDRR